MIIKLLLPLFFASLAASAASGVLDFGSLNQYHGQLVCKSSDREEGLNAPTNII
jgi:hypothetical protein